MLPTRQFCCYTSGITLSNTTRDDFGRNRDDTGRTPGWSPTAGVGLNTAPAAELIPSIVVPSDSPNHDGPPHGPQLWSPRLVLYATCTVLRTGSVPGASGARRWPGRAESADKSGAGFFCLSSLRYGPREQPRPPMTTVCVRNRRFRP